MKQIKLTQGKVALVDDADYAWLSQWKWYAWKDLYKNFYAVRKSPQRNGKQNMIRMHRQILGLAVGDKRQTDHQNHNTLDNRRNNIRICTCQENQMNQKPQSNTTSKYKGVSWHRRDKRWQAYIQINRKRRHLGYFTTEKEAATAYNKAAKKHYKEFAYLNPAEELK